MKKSGSNPLRNWVEVILFSAVTYVVIYLILAILAKYLPNIISDYTRLMDGYELNKDWRNWIYVILLAPAGEELIFRGMLFKLCRDRMSFLWANIIQAALFGLVHTGTIQMIYTFVLGLILGYVYENYKEIKYNVVFHVLFNFWNIPMQWAAGLILGAVGCIFAL